MIFLAGTKFGISAGRRPKTLKNQWSGRQDYSARGRASPLRGRPAGVDATEDFRSHGHELPIENSRRPTEPSGRYPVLRGSGLEPSRRGERLEGAILGRGDRIRTCDIYVPNVPGRSRRHNHRRSPSVSGKPETFCT
jgi:hypothetical protein